ncbi:hypothetical protein H2203_002387 [Taxawa tesnikishii (nom. ined.)]|nr:hypothetical protein H2203_002387 [Dothideales sp. JES 119]
MLSTALLSLATLTSLFTLTSALPQSAHTDIITYDKSGPTLYLVSSTSAAYPFSGCAKDITNAGAIGLLDDYISPQGDALVLRTIDKASAINGLPTFNLTHGHLSTESMGSHGIGGPFQYQTTGVNASDPSPFAPVEGHFTVTDGYLLGLDGRTEGFRICPGDFGESVITWLGRDAACQSTYLHVYPVPPYGVIVN